LFLAKNTNSKNNQLEALTSSNEIEPKNNFIPQHVPCPYGGVLSPSK